MPWRGPRELGEYPTLGYDAGEWIEDMCVIPDGVNQGDKYRLTDEMWRFLIRFYRLKLDGRFYYRGGLLMRPQKWGKGPFAAAICLAEAFGPVAFDGWNAQGEPVGASRPTPWVQIVATSEEQTQNTYGALREMAQRGPIADLPGIDIGILDVNLPDGGKIEPQTSSGRARLGARLTFAIFDESHMMTENNGGVLLATTMKRNLAGMGGRWLETTNAYDPSERSVAQRTHESPADDLCIDYRPCPRNPDFGSDDDCLELLGYVYGDSYWVDRERVLADARDPATCPTAADAFRFFFNMIVVGSSTLVEPAVWAGLAREDEPLKQGEAVTLGFDGSRANDCTALVLCRVRDGRWFHLRTWKPADYPEHRVPHNDVNRLVEFAFKAFDVKYLFADPYLWQDYTDLWEGRWPKRIVEFPTNKDTRMDAALTRFLAGVSEGSLTHDGDPTLAQHVRNAALTKGARKAPRPDQDPSVVQHYLKVIKKRPDAHIDALVAGLLAYEARGQAVEEGAINGKAKAWIVAR